MKTSWQVVALVVLAMCAGAAIDREWAFGVMPVPVTRCVDL